MKKSLNHQFLKKYENHPMTPLFNCWGGTVMYFRNSKNPRRTWLTGREMNNWTKQFCEEILELEINSIICLYRDQDSALVHSMVYLGNNKVWHKIGSAYAEITTLNNALDEYLLDENDNTCSTVKIFKLKKKAFSLNQIKTSYAKRK